MKKAIDLSNNKEVAIKMLRLSGRGYEEKKLMLLSFFKEISILSRCRHPNIVKLLDASFTGTLTKEAFLDANHELSAVRKTSVDHSKIEIIDS